MKRILVRFSLIIFFLVSLSIRTHAQGSEVRVYMFTREGCPHCSAEKEFLSQLVQNEEFSDVKVMEYEIMSAPQNAALLGKVGKYFKVDVGGVPFTVIGSKYFVGFLNSKTTGEELKAAIKDVQAGNDSDVVADLMSGGKAEVPIKANLSDEARQLLPETLTLPIFGTFNLRELSLPALTVVIALFDGFNPCAMWVLLFLISLLLGMGDKRKMWLLGGTFIFISGLVYFLLLSAWLNVFMFIGYALWVRLFIGFFAVGAGLHSLSKTLRSSKGGCEVVNTDEKRKVFDRIKKIIQKDNLLLALGGISILAFAVNIVEAMCSAGLPAVYTKVLTISELPLINYYAYLLLYVFIFMIDDLIVFVVAMTTLRTIGIESKYANYSHIIGGLVMLIIGILMIFRPELLSFGGA